MMGYVGLPSYVDKAQDLDQAHHVFLSFGSHCIKVLLGMR